MPRKVSFSRPAQRKFLENRVRQVAAVVMDPESRLAIRYSAAMMLQTLQAVAESLTKERIPLTQAVYVQVGNLNLIGEAVFNEWEERAKKSADAGGAADTGAGGGPVGEAVPPGEPGVDVHGPGDAAGSVPDGGRPVGAGDAGTPGSVEEVVG